MIQKHLFDEKVHAYKQQTDNLGVGNTKSNYM